MVKNLTRSLSITLATMMLFAGCTSTPTQPSSNTASEEKKEESSPNKESSSHEKIKDLVLPVLASNELTTFNILYAQKADDSHNLTNLVDALVEADPKGKLVPCIAQEWGSDDGGLTWTFKLRSDVKWADVNGQEKADCNSYDFATGLEWVLNFHKNESINTSMPTEMIAGAREYYEYTKSLSEEEAYKLNASEGSKFREMVGLETPDEYTVVYKCVAKKPYFDSLATYNCLYPAPQALIDELGPKEYKAINNKTMWYNGCYTMTSYVQGNEKVYTKNPTYWDKDCERFDTVTMKMVESTDVAYQLYESGEVDYVQLNESRINTIAKDPAHPMYPYVVPDVPSKHSYQFHFNFDKKNKDGTPDENWNKAIANESFRKVWWYGLDLSDYFKRSNAINPMICENNFYTMKGLCYTSNGTDYTELVRKEMGLPKENGKTPIRLDKKKAEEYKKKAIEELTKIGVTFPVEADYYVMGSNQTAVDGATVLKQAFTDSFGDDFIKLNIKTFIKSQRQEVQNFHLQSFATNGWGADYGDPQNFLSQELIGYASAAYSVDYAYINDVKETPETKELLETYKKYTQMVEEADLITDDFDARYEAYAKAEAYLLDKVIVLPVNYGIGWALSKVDNDTKMNALYGIQNNKIKNWDSNVDGYTSEDKGVAKQIAAFTEANK